MTSIVELLKEVWADQEIRLLLIFSFIVGISSSAMEAPPTVWLAIAIGFLVCVIIIELTEGESVEVKLPEKTPPPEVKMPPSAKGAEFELETIGTKEEPEIPSPPPEPFAEERIAKLERTIEEQASEIETLKKDKEKLLDVLTRARDKLKKVTETKTKEKEETAKKIREETSYVDIAKKYGVNPVVLDTLSTTLEGMETPAELPIAWFKDYFEDEKLIKNYIAALRKLKFRIVKKKNVYWLQ